MQSPPEQGLTINAPTSLEPGVYVNIFPVTFIEGPVSFMVASRGGYPDLRPLRNSIQSKGWHTQLYGHGNKVYGYGADMEYLVSEGFEEEIVQLADLPQLTTHLIENGILDLLNKEGYQARIGKGRLIVFHPGRFTSAANGQIKVHQGYDLRSTFWRDQFTGNLAFGLVVDTIWSIRDGSGQPMNTRCYHRIWWINRPALCKPTLGWIFGIEQSGKVTSFRGEALSEFFCWYLHRLPRGMALHPH